MRLLLTGATGFLGGALATLVAQRHPALPATLLVRNPCDVQPNLARFGGKLPAHWQLLAADLSRPETLDELSLREFTHVVHLAACTSFRSRRRVRSINLEGTLALAQRLTTVERFLYVGTAYICGTKANATVYEDDFPQDETDHPAEYTRTKAECEAALSTLGPSLLVARPSAVVGHTVLGCSPSSSLFWYYRALAQLGRLPVPAATLRDVVPVDYVAEALMTLLFKPDLAHRCYHISAGSSAVSLGEICRQLLPGQQSYQTVSYERLCEEWDSLKERLGPGDDQRVLQALGYLWRFSTCGAQVFDNSRLLAEAVPPPPPFTDYLDVCAVHPGTICEQLVDD